MLLKLSENFKKPELWNWKIYRGVVVDNADPTKIKRARVTIDGIYPEGSNDSLPWVAAMTDNPKSLNAPEIGDELAVIFPYDDVYHPFYLGYWNPGTSGKAYLQDDYPNTFGFIYDNLKARFNKNTKIGEMVHSSGSGIAVDADGNLVLTGAKDVTATVAGKVDVNATSDITINASAKLTANVVGDMELNVAKLTVNSDGDVIISSNGMATFSGTGGTTIGSGGAHTTVLGSLVTLGGQGGNPVALVGVSLVIGPGNMGGSVISQILTGSSIVMAAP